MMERSFTPALRRHPQSKAAYGVIGLERKNR